MKNLLYNMETAITNKLGHWRGHHIPSMTPPVVQDYIYDVGTQWTGQGVCIELGCWMGATSVPLLTGLVEAGYNRTYWAFDKWMANGSEIQKAVDQGLPVSLNQTLLPIYKSNVVKVYNKVKTVQGKLPKTLGTFDNSIIEICLFDAPKRTPIFEQCIARLLPHFIPGVTVLALLDYDFYKSRRKSGENWQPYMAPVKFIERHHNHFEKMSEWPEQTSGVFFKYVKEIK